MATGMVAFLFPACQTSFLTLVLSRFFTYRDVCSVMYNKTISAILRGEWMVDPTWAHAHLPIVAGLLRGEETRLLMPRDVFKSYVERTGNEGIEQPFVLDAKTMQRYEWRGGNNPNIPENGVGVIPISGPITKYNGDCGEPGAMQRDSWIMGMQKRANIGSIVLLMDTPGGEARAANASVNIIQRSSKPILAYGDGMVASLGMWYASAAKEFYLSHETDRIGSIGSLCMLADFAGYFEKEGIKIHEIYAPQSEDKNKDYRDALKGDYSQIQSVLKDHVDLFTSFVKTNRPKSAQFAGEWGTGKMFGAKEATRIGLSDGIRPFSEVVSKAAWLGKRTK